MMARKEHAHPEQRKQTAAGQQLRLSGAGPHDLRTGLGRAEPLGQDGVYF